MTLALLLLASCGAPEPAVVAPAPAPADPVFPETARVETWREMKADVAAARAPSDGGGRVTLEEGGSVQVGEAGRWSLLYEAGPLGIATGGRLVFQSPPFWGWSPAQAEEPEVEGFVTVESLAQGVGVRVETPMPGMVTAEVTGRALAPGERVRVVYGAGSQGAVADRFAERRQALYLGVDGDGDGVRALVAGLPTVDVAAAPPVRLQVTLPTVAHPGERVLLRIAALDGQGNAGHPTALQLGVEARAALGAPDVVALGEDQRGLAAVPVAPKEEGVYVVRVVGPGGLEGTSNPMVVRAGAAHVLWGDLQIHTGLSDGTGTPEDAYRYARDVAGLDVAVVTDHDHWGMRFLDQDPAMWDEVVGAAEAAYEPGRFVTAVGYEWTSWLHGHRHVVYFDGSRDLFSSLDDRYDTPTELWGALSGKGALTFAHHPAGGPVPTDWDIPPDPGFEPLVEIVSVHGQSESPDVPGAIYDAAPGNFVVDQLARGYTLGFVGSTDGHDGHPGLAHLAGPSGGLVGIVTEERTREGVAAALRARRTYATNGARMLLRVDAGGREMGSVTAPVEGDLPVDVRVVGTAPVMRLELVSRQGVIGSARPDTIVAHQTWTVSGLAAGDFLYVRAWQADGGMAWSSPIFAR